MKPRVHVQAPIGYPPRPINRPSTPFYLNLLLYRPRPFLATSPSSIFFVVKVSPLLPVSHLLFTQYVHDQFMGATAQPHGHRRISRKRRPRLPWTRLASCKVLRYVSVPSRRSLRVWYGSLGTTTIVHLRFGESTVSTVRLE